MSALSPPSCLTTFRAGRPIGWESVRRLLGVTPSGMARRILDPAAISLAGKVRAAKAVAEEVEGSAAALAAARVLPRSRCALSRAVAFGDPDCYLPGKFRCESGR